MRGIACAEKNTRFVENGGIWGIIAGSCPDFALTVPAKIAQFAPHSRGDFTVSVPLKVGGSHNEQK
jgi:hypothetical protein